MQKSSQIINMKNEEKKKETLMPTFFYSENK